LKEIDMAEIDSIGLIELSSVARGFVVQDAMIKAANVQVLMARTICSGKYIVCVTGDISAVQASVDAGIAVGTGAVIEQRVISRLHPGIFPAILGNVYLEPTQADALGIIETFSASSIIEVADAAVKAANVTLFRVHLAMALGGKGFVLLTGDVASTEAAVTVGARVAGRDGILVDRAVIPRPSRELFKEFV
jgi:microcompartment protein CcmL/EutN